MKKHHPSHLISNGAGNTVQLATLPAESSIASAFKDADLVDSFSITPHNDVPYDIDLIARIIFDRPVWWVRGLLAIRDNIVARFGLKTTDELRCKARAEGNKSIDFFPVLARNANELVLGENDRHLDFKISILLRMPVNRSDFEVLVTTVVHCHNNLGRLYLALIKPFHVLVVRSSLKRVGRKT
ncbi:DUF2867 domain-containing protein [Gluconacetobacter entanii]|uniref:DUF2867 domain-containing protein n=1 Tax=Gluconacetobacter entanii TaxID=108528 RepID=A0A318PVD6_9PROT|nr:DUF2867 domain-containing protein [Gluconacetobacter entanii]PYD62522.1 hypothetical protein CFR72_12080 [Gluconacetobacter entanii]